MSALVDADLAAVAGAAAARAIDFETIDDVVYGAMWIIFAPASWCWPGPANATESVSPLACSPTR